MNTSKNLGVEGLRGYLILCIVLYHYTCRYPFYGGEAFCWDQGFSSGKILGIVGFFILSGYFLIHSLMVNQMSFHKDLLNAIGKKVKRLYFPFAVVIIFLAIVGSVITFLNNPRWTDYLTNIFALRCVAKLPLIDGAHWYFYAMMQLSILVPIFWYAVKCKKICFGALGLILLAYLFGTHTFAASKGHLLAFLAGAALAIDNRFFRYATYFSICILQVFLFKTCFIILVYGIIAFLINSNGGGAETTNSTRDFRKQTYSLDRFI